MLKLAVIGDPISHSLSPEIHSEILSRLGIPAEYIAVHVKRGELARWVEYAVREGFRGFNVTMPHKLDIIEFLSDIDHEARHYGAVNTVTIENGKLYGHNTDGRGFLMSMLEQGVILNGKNITIAGTGGAATTLAKASEAAGAKSVISLDRKRLPELPLLAPQTDIFINATPLGMHNCAQWENLSFIDMLAENSAVFDSIYNPLKTKLLCKSQRRGLTIINGLGMLVCQALLADEIFTSFYNS